MPPKRSAPSSSKELLFKDDDQYYAHVIKALGDRRFSILTDDGVELIGKLRGNMRRREYVAPGCIVLCSLRPGETGKADILHKYVDQHTKLLRRYGELETLHAQVAKYNKEIDSFGQSFEDDEDLVRFEDVDVDEIIDTL
jgi:translation initiation factor 1A